MNFTRKYWGLLFLVLSAGLFSCRQNKAVAPRFTLLESGKTGINFANRLKATPDFNMFNYMYFYNGAGIGAGDFNQDGLVDLFFAGNQVGNSLYLNIGNLQFRDITRDSKIPQDGGWSTGISVVDINNDGRLDVYVCRVGAFANLNSRNQLLINTGNHNGVPQFSDSAAAYGIDFSGFSTQAAFIDYDLDGDLDMYLMNHSIHHNGTFGERKKFLGTSHPLAGDRFFRNGGNRFEDITAQAGINSSAIGYGLGLAVSDINYDGYPDIYIGNDFHENDYLYINQRDGSFRDELADRIMHTSQFSMGVDIADINNDAAPEIISMDMLPDDPYILKRSLGEDEYNLFQMKIRYGYNHQYARNNLQLNDGRGRFRETGLYSGVSATDWSWAPLWFDFDNDGNKDLFVSNGIPKRLNDIDYVNYVSNEEVQAKIREGRMDDREMNLIEKFPQIKLPNRFFLNKGSASFADAGDSVENNRSTYSNGAVYADLDNDGDLDIVVNNIDEPAMVYRNNTAGEKKTNRYLRLELMGADKNIRAIGATAIVYSGNTVHVYEKYPVRGFQSSMEIPLHIGLTNVSVDSILLIWPDRTFQRVSITDSTRKVRLDYNPGLPVFNKASLRVFSERVQQAGDLTQESGLGWMHRENPFVEFNREPLIPRMISTEGPALAVADINHDGLEDVFIGAARNATGVVFLQGGDGRFRPISQPALASDSAYEDVDACWTDVNKDGHPDLVVVSGGNEFYGNDSVRQPRLYLNDGNGRLMKRAGAFPKIYLTGSVVAPNDLNGDGYTDLFIGARSVPFEYGSIPASYLLLNNGKGGFEDHTIDLAPGLLQAGLVKHAEWADINGDKEPELLVATEWNHLQVYEKKAGKYVPRSLGNGKGWWNMVRTFDADNDGDLDLLAGNLGLNSRLKAGSGEPVRLYFGDFDGNGKKEQVLTYYLHGRELPFANKAELEKQIPLLKKKFLYAEDFAKATLEDLFGKTALDTAMHFTADNFSSQLLMNDGKGNFTAGTLPWEAQLSTLNAVAFTDINGDGLTDILTGGNFYENNIQMGRNDADPGAVLVNRGKGAFEYRLIGLPYPVGQVRKISPLKSVTSGEVFILARNSDSLLVIQLEKH